MISENRRKHSYSSLYSFSTSVFTYFSYTTPVSMKTTWKTLIPMCVCKCVFEKWQGHFQKRDFIASGIFCIFLFKTFSLSTCMIVLHRHFAVSIFLLFCLWSFLCRVSVSSELSPTPSIVSVFKEKHGQRRTVWLCLSVSRPHVLFISACWLLPSSTITWLISQVKWLDKACLHNAWAKTLSH